MTLQILSRANSCGYPVEGTGAGKREMMRRLLESPSRDSGLSADVGIRICKATGGCQVVHGLYNAFVMRRVKYIWALPNTCVGLFFIPLARRRKWVDGVLEIHGGRVSWFLRHCTVLKGGAAAMTLGHIVLGVDQESLDRTREHERVHVRQCERWGPFFLPAYLLCSLYLFVRRRDAYWENPFEMDARSKARD